MSRRKKWSKRPEDHLVWQVIVNKAISCRKKWPQSQKMQLLAARNCQKGNFLGLEMAKKARRPLLVAARNDQQSNFSCGKKCHNSKNAISCSKKLPKRQLLVARNGLKGKKTSLAARKSLFDNFLPQEIAFLPFWPVLARGNCPLGNFILKVARP